MSALFGRRDLKRIQSMETEISRAGKERLSRLKKIGLKFLWLPMSRPEDWIFPKSLMSSITIFQIHMMIISIESAEQAECIKKE